MKKGRIYLQMWVLKKVLNVIGNEWIVRRMCPVIKIIIIKFHDLLLGKNIPCIGLRNHNNINCGMLKYHSF